MTSKDLSRRTSPLTAALLSVIVVFGTSCGLKDSEFFTTLSEALQGSIFVTVDGAPSGAQVRVNGLIVDQTMTVGESGYNFEALPYGSYTVTVTPPEGYECSPSSATVEVTEENSDHTVLFECFEQPGAILATVNGASAEVAFTGPAGAVMPIVGGGLVGGTPALFGVLPPGVYTVTVSSPSGFICSPESIQVTVISGITAPAIFECTPSHGSLSVTVDGADAEVSFSGPATSPMNGGGLVGGTPVVFADLAAGTYTVSVANPSGLECSPQTVQVDVIGGQTTTVEFTCTPIPGALSVSVSGATAEVSYSGPSTAPGSGGGLVGSTPVTFGPLPPGEYSVSISPPPGFGCAPIFQNVTVPSGGTAVALFVCTPLPSSISVTVTGATTTVNYTGPDGGGSFSGSDVATTLNSLPSGLYSFTVVVPAGMECPPTNIDVDLMPGQNPSIQFDCAALPQPLTVNVALNVVPNTGGVVPSGPFNVVVYDEFSAPVGFMGITAFGGSTFWVLNKLGFADGSGFRFDLVFDVYSQPYEVTGYALCVDPAPISVADPLTIGLLDSGLTPLGVTHITAPGCYWIPLPSGTVWIDIFAPPGIAVDTHSHQLWR